MLENRSAIESPTLRLAYTFMTGIVFNALGDLSDLAALIANGNCQTKARLACQCFLTWQIETVINLPPTPYQELAEKSADLDPNYIGTLGLFDEVIAADGESVLATIAGNIDMIRQNLDDYLKYGSVQGE